MNCDTCGQFIPHGEWYYGDSKNTYCMKCAKVQESYKRYYDEKSEAGDDE